MKNIKLSVIFAVVLLAGSASSAFALSASPEAIQQIKDKLREDIKNTRDSASSTIKDKIGEARGEIQQVRAGIIQNRIENKFSKMTARFQATIDRLNGIMAKIQSRIDKVKSAGGKTSDAEKAIADAKTNIDKAQALMATLNSTADTAGTADASTTPKVLKEAMTGLNKASNDIQKLLKQAYTSLMKSIGSLKGLKSSDNNGPDVNASSTSSI
jgi:DNA repair exonuclease SbcCD ATPase subunit